MPTQRVLPFVLRTDMSRFFSSKYSRLEAYVPGEQPKDMKYIKLNTNESPFPPSKKALEAARLEAGRLQLYSDPECTVLTEKAAEVFGVSKECVLMTNGSDEILNFAFMAFCDREHPIVFPDITYGFYPVFAELNGIPYEQIPLKEDFSVDYSDYVSVNKNVVIANPNAPTGIFKPLCEIEKILAANPDSVVLVDEAYIDFGGESALKLLDKYKNLLVVRTYSKSRSLAGARLGFAFADKEIIDDLSKIKFSTNPYSINRLTLIAGEAALKDGKYYEDNAKKIIETRAFVTEKLRAMGFEVVESAANFVLAGHDKISGSDFAEEMKKRGILIRHFSGERLEKYNRITIGTRAEMEAFLFAAEKIIG